MMNHVKIKTYQKGLVFQDRKIVDILNEGTFWIFGNKKVQIYEMTLPLIEGEDTNLLLKNESLINLLEIVEVQDNQIVLLYEKGIFKDILKTGQYAYWKGIIDRKFVPVDLSKVQITEDISINILESNKMHQYVRKIVVANQYKGLLFIDGKLNSVLEAGSYYFWNNAIGIEVRSLDTRMQQMEIAGQELLTKDKANLRLNFQTRYQVTDIGKALLGSKEYDKQLYTLMQLALREYVGKLTLDELLSNKESVGKEILNSIGNKAEYLGLKISDTGIRDIILTGEMKDIMNQVLMAEKKAQANSIMRREETAATRSMLNTAKMMEENEVLWKLKEMEYMEKIADKIGDITVSGNSNIVTQLKEIFAK